MNKAPKTLKSSRSTQGKNEQNDKAEDKTENRLMETNDTMMEKEQYISQKPVFE